MTLKEAMEHPTNTRRMALNRVGDNTIIVGKISDTEYLCRIDTKDTDPDTNPKFELYPNLQDVENHFTGLSFDMDIDPNGWTIDPEGTEL